MTVAENTKQDGNLPSNLTSRHALLLMNCGFTSGLIQAFIFNPWDRALYLSVKHERPFIRWDNFQNPMSGVSQTVVQRAISAGLYFPLEELTTDALEFATGYYNSFTVFCAGTIAGVANGVLMNPFTRVKVSFADSLSFLELRPHTPLFSWIQYHYWGKVDTGKENFLSTAVEIFRTGGVRQFFVGTMATVHRDLLFGGIFALLRHQVLPLFLPEHKRKHNKKRTDFFSNLVAGTAATILSSPLNYVRNIHYSTSPSVAPEDSMTLLRNLWKESLKEGSRYKTFLFLQHRLRLGWGTARVGCGMAVGSKLYELCTQVAG